MHVIALPKLTDFIEEARRAGCAGNVAGPEVRVLHTQRAGRHVIPTCWLGVRLTVQAKDKTLVWVWERDFHVDAEGKAVTAENRAREQAFQKAQSLIEEALTRAGIPAHKLRPGMVALSKDLELVQGVPDVLRFERDGEGLLTVDFDPAWLASLEAKAA